MAAIIKQKIVYVFWSEQSESQSRSCIPLSHLQCLVMKVYLSIFGSQFYFISSFVSWGRAVALVNYLLLKIILSLYTPYFIGILLYSSFLSKNYTSLAFFISNRKYFQRASMPRSFLQPEIMRPSSSILKSKRSTHSILLNWSFTNILFIKVSHWSLILFSSFGIRSSVSFITFISCEMELDSNGQYPKSIQKSTTPNDQISAFSVQISSFNISGAMQMGDPSIVWAIFIQSILQNPKSPSLTLPSEKKILSGLRSLCMMLFLLSSLKAQSSCLKMTRASSSLSIFFFCSSDQRVPPLQYQQTKQKLLGVFSVQTNLTMFSFFRVERMFISLIASCYNLGLALNEDLGITFTANSSFDF